MTFDELFEKGVTKLSPGDRVAIVGPGGDIVAGPLVVVEVSVITGDWIELLREDGTTYMEGNLLVTGESPADTSHLPDGWRFNKIVSV